MYQRYGDPLITQCMWGPRDGWEWDWSNTEKTGAWQHSAGRPWADACRLPSVQAVLAVIPRKTKVMTTIARWELCSSQSCLTQVLSVLLNLLFLSCDSCLLLAAPMGPCNEPLLLLLVGGANPNLKPSDLLYWGIKVHTSVWMTSS